MRLNPKTFAAEDFEGEMNKNSVHIADQWKSEVEQGELTHYFICLLCEFLSLFRIELLIYEIVLVLL
jgi:hypothetical protein